MKRVLIISVFLIVAIWVTAQCDHPYRSFDKFANDTTAFLRYNFRARADCYKGKKVSDVLRDLQLTPIEVTTLYSTSVGKYSGIRIFVDNNREYEIISRKAQYIYIYWPELMDDKNAISLSRAFKGIWHQTHYEFFKNNIVGEVAYYE